MKELTAAKILHAVLKDKKNPKIKLLGDSITHGVGGSGFSQDGELIVPGWSQNPNGYCWANLFRDYMKEKYGATVVNKACTGTDIVFITKHFDELVDADDDIILCTIGTNNRHVLHANSAERPEREAFGGWVYDVLKKLYAMLEATGIPVILVANIPASAKNEQDGADYWRVLHMDDINKIYKHLKEQTGATLVSMYDLFSAHCEQNGIAIDTLLADGLHPNDEGYRVMFELITRALEV